MEITIDKYFELQKEIYDYFGYVEDWVVIPIEDSRGYFWMIIDGEGHGGGVRFAEKKEELLNEDKREYYQNTIYTQCFLKKWVYRAKKYTMICADTHTDGNKFLQIFDNVKEIKQEI